MNDNEDFLNQLRRFDIYSKVDEDFRVQTLGGAYLSMFGWVVIAILVMAELNSFFSLEYKEHMIVDTSLREKVAVYAIRPCT